MVFMNEFCENLRRLMKRKDYDVTKLAKLSGVSHSLISKYLRGDKEPTIEFLISLSLGLGCTIDELVGVETITVFERRILEAYRELPDGERKRIVELLLLSESFFEDDNSSQEITIPTPSPVKA